MRGLSSRNVRPSLAQRHLLHTCTPVRRTFLLPNKRRFNAADAFSIFLTPILTTAFIIDSTAKQDKSKELDRQIAAVEEESERLRERQIQAWSRIQRRSVSNGAWQQRRAYSTAAQAVVAEDDMEDPMDHDVLSKDPEEDEAKMALSETVSPDEMNQVQLFDRLIATRLALQLLLQLKSGNSTLYALPIENAPQYQFAKKHHSLDYLLSELGKVGRILHALYKKNLPYGATHPLEYLEKRRIMSLELTNLTDQYRKCELHLPEFVMSYMNLIAKHQMGPPVSNYVDMLRVFQKMGVMPMAVIAESAVWESQQYLDNKAVSSILFCQGTEMDAYRLKEFLKRMTRSNLFPRPEKKWYEMQLEDYRLATPATKNPWVLASLIRASLCCQQFSIAEAYAQEFLRRDATFQYEGRFKCWLSSCFLATYSRVASWKSGLKWINQAILWMSDMLQDGIASGEHLLGRCILRMMEYCVVCDKRDVYEELLRAAVVHSIPCPPIDTTKPISVTKRMLQIRLDWQGELTRHQTEHKIKEQEVRQEMVSQENLKAFQQQLWSIFDLPHGGVLPTKPNKSHKVIRRVELSDPAEELSQSRRTRLKAVHQSASVKTTTLALLPPIAPGSDGSQPEQYVFEPYPDNSPDALEATYASETEMHVPVQRTFVIDRRSRPRSNPKTRNAPSGLPEPITTEGDRVDRQTRASPAQDPESESPVRSEDSFNPDVSKQSPEQSEQSYEDFWPHMSLTKDSEVIVLAESPREKTFNTP